MVGYFINRIKAFGHAFNGIYLLFKESAHARVHLLAVLVVTGFGLYLEITKVEWLAIILCYGLVISMEALNSAIEYAIDLVSPDIHQLAKKAKDVAAAAVLISAMVSFLVAILIFSSYLA